jgi:ribonuclease J
LPRSSDDDFYDGMLDAVETALERITASERKSDYSVEEAVRIGIRRFTRREIGKNPGVAVLITRRDEIEFR